MGLKPRSPRLFNAFKTVYAYSLIMPGQAFDKSQTTDLPLVDTRWCIRITRTSEYRMRAQMMRWHVDLWRPIGPWFEGGSPTTVLARLVSGYRDLADLIEASFLFDGMSDIADGCSKCGYEHPRFYSTAEATHHSCPICYADVKRSTDDALAIWAAKRRL